LIVLPAMMLAGVVADVAGTIIATAGIGYLLYRDRHDSIIILSVMILLLGDSRLENLQFVKSLRVEVMVILFMISLHEIHNNCYKLNTMMLYFVPFAIVSLLALTFSPLMEVGLGKTLSFIILYFVVFHYVKNKLQRYGIQLMIDVQFLIVIVLSVGFLLYPLFPQFVSYGGFRYNGIMGNPNGMGILVTLSIPLTTYLFTRHRDFTPQYKAFVWVLLILSLLLCSSRNAIFSSALYAIVFLGLQGSTFRRIIFLFVFLPAAGLVLYKIDFETIFTSLGLGGYFRVKDLESGSGRIFAWAYALELIGRAPLIGCGFACEEYYFVYKSTFRLWHTGHQGGVHNSYLAYAINTGLVGLGLYLGFLIQAALRVRNLHHLVPFILASFFSAAFESWLFSSLSAFHTIFLLTLVFMIVDTNRVGLLVSNLPGEFTYEPAKGGLK
jgi:O-antigen ligase